MYAMLTAKEIDRMNFRAGKNNNTQSGPKSHEKTIFLSRHNNNTKKAELRQCSFRTKVFLWLAHLIQNFKSLKIRNKQIKGLSR